MDFYRNTIHFTQINDDYMSYIYNQFNNFGFCRRDGSELYWQGNPTDNTDEQLDKISFRWKKDTTNKNVFRYQMNAGYNASNSLEFYWSGGGTSFINFGNNIGEGKRSIIFIPLKNNNFILQQFSFKNSITPSFHTPNEGFNGLEYYNYSSNLGETIISFQLPSSFLNPFYYIKHRYWGNTNSGATGVYQSFIDQSQESFKLNKFCNKEWDSVEDTNITIHNYNNINQNICTLIRVPYENTFFDGLYLCTTYPCNQIEGKVFSFNGRNFLGICENFVVELPAN